MVREGHGGDRFVPPLVDDGAFGASYSTMTRPARVVVLSAVLPLGAAAQEPQTSLRAAGFDIQVIGDLKGFALQAEVKKIEDGLEVLSLTLRNPQRQTPPRFSVKWAVPSHDVAGHWMTGRFVNKTMRPDWSNGRLQASMFAREAPVSCLFTSDNKNVLTFAVSDALNTISAGSGVREEDGLIYNEVVFFAERHEALTEYRAEIRIDRRPVPYERTLRGVADWWAAQPGYRPATVPAAARLPVYSTWYNFHQKVDSAELLKEVAVAKKLGFETIIVDDGWQTLDASRGYAFTGDWEPERIPDMKGFVDACHRMGIKVVLWYAVPFVGKNAKVAARFKDKSLQFDQRLGAYVVDPRFPDVRRYLIDIYSKAMREWGLDGFKLDFIDRFVADEQTVLEAAGGRDYASVNEATDRLMTDIITELEKLNADVMIEFRQPYIGPLIRKYGNMFRASDSPNAYLANRVKVIDLRLLSGTTAVHADMIMWHEGEPVEIAAFQLLNILFSVPQVSVRLQHVPADHFEMVKFYTKYWIANRAVLLDGELDAPFPSANYPLVRARTPEKEIVAVYNDVVVDLNGARSVPRFDVVNAKHSGAVVLAVPGDMGDYRYEVRDCRGRIVKSGRTRLAKGAVSFEVPVSGLLSLEHDR
jgi:alpha-galactosidase